MVLNPSSAFPPAAVQGPTLFRHAAFVPPGYTSLLFAHLYEDASCPLPTRLFAAFRSFLLASFGLGEHAATVGGMLGQGRDSAGAGTGGAVGGSTAGGAAGRAAGAAGGFASGSISTLAVRLISRRPGKGKRKMARQIGNEDELLAALRTLGEAWSNEAGASTGGAAQPSSVSVSLLDFANLTGVALAATRQLLSGSAAYDGLWWLLAEAQPQPVIQRG